MLRPFAEAAMDLHRRGLAVLPCPADDGKSPKGAVRGFQNWKGPPSPKFVQDMIARWPDANIGVVTSASKLTVVDIDGGDDIFREMIDRCGDTPLIGKTPSGGRHAFYRANGERSGNLRSQGLPVDVKGERGGLIIIPPSVRPSTGGLYLLERGSWDDLVNLPTARAGSLPLVGEKAVSAPAANHTVIVEGRRNTELFVSGLRLVRSSPNFHAFLAEMRLFNREQCLPPLDDEEVLAVTRNAWGYQRDNRNFVGGPAQVRIGGDEIDALIPYPNGGDAFLLLGKLRASHPLRPEFAISARAMARNEVMGDWRETRIRRARDTLLAAGFLEQVYEGGHAGHDPSRFRLALPT